VELRSRGASFGKPRMGAFMQRVGWLELPLNDRHRTRILLGVGGVLRAAHCFALLKRHTAHRIRGGDKAKSPTSSCLLRLASSARFTTPDPFSFLFFLPNRNVPFSMKSGFFFKKRQKS